MIKNTESKDATELIDNKKKDEFIDPKVAKDETEAELSKRDKFFNQVSQKLGNWFQKKPPK